MDLSPTIWTSCQTSRPKRRKMFPFAFALTPLSLFLLRQSQPSLATATTVTIDDEYGDSLTGELPLYSGAWKYGPDCSGCFLQPSPADAFMSGWHDTTTSTQYAQQNVTLTFHGTFDSLLLLDHKATTVILRDGNNGVLYCARLRGIRQYLRQHEFPFGWRAFRFLYEQSDSNGNRHGISLQCLSL